MLVVEQPLAWPGSAYKYWHVALTKVPLNKEICENIGIEDVNLTKSNQNTYMKLVLEALHRKN